MREKIIQFLKFGLVGGSNTLISLLIYYILIFLGINYLISNSIGYIVSSISGYFLNKIWVFNSKDDKSNKSLFKYYMVYGSSFILNIGVMYMFINVIKISYIISPVLTMCITIPYNFILNKLWVFSADKNKNN